MAFGDSTEKDVRVSLSVDGADEVKAILADITDTLRRLRDGQNTINVKVSDPTLSAKLDEIRQKVHDLGAEDAKIDVKLDGFDQAILKLTALDKLKKSVSGNADVKVNVQGAGRAAAELGAADVAKDAGGPSKLSRLIGLAGLGENPTALMQGGGLATVLTSPIGAGTIAALLPVIGALGAFAGGSAIAGVGVEGAYKMGSAAAGTIGTDKTQIASLQRAIANLGTSSAAGRTRAYDVSVVVKDQAAIAHLEKVDGGVIKIYNDLKNVGKIASDVFRGAISGGGKNSFANQVGRDLKGIGPMIKQLQPDLTKLFQASAPYAKAFVAVLDGFAKTVLPAMTSALNDFAPHLPGLIRSFQIISDVVGSLIKSFAWLGTAMALAVTDGVKVWKAGEPVFKAVIGGVTKAVKFLQSAFEGVAHAVEDAISWIGKIAGALGHLPGGGVAGSILAHVGLAGGGVLPGYAPGRDSIPAMLSPGESVLTPEATRAIGAGNILRANAMSGRPTARTAGVLHAAGGFLGGGGGFSGGGFSAGDTIVNINLNGIITNPDATARQIQQALLTFKRHNGNRSLGLT